ncbi:hypothetical protein, unlikely [Trypanosoma brucei gambiense DAL972]|uniref:Uncharacterized protein n=1 Tax=Trypanosoma brucei gambiense (strain MHOM/CI/86/DAL972) TaxID=679716 RepID=D0A189_TRYB9|nr:hypothetical protein, unlikely [Trypanosoma brucei gambiense DAL972]CBH15031.1 hypothetical protein, unlikely [Trypanosoma brucei gambiense DAL972]|eukprot:XP_011777297.1 hypothetical protein, unlikely [Trypanosoma brucei gambiense DAL972]
MSRSFFFYVRVGEDGGEMVDVGRFEWELNHNTIFSVCFFFFFSSFYCSRCKTKEQIAYRHIARFFIIIYYFPPPSLCGVSLSPIAFSFLSFMFVHLLTVRIEEQLNNGNNKGQLHTSPSNMRNGIFEL